MSGIRIESYERAAWSLRENEWMPWMMDDAYFDLRCWWLVADAVRLVEFDCASRSDNYVIPFP